MGLGIGGIIQGAVGAAQAIGGAIQQRKALKEIKNLEKNAPQYSQNQSIMDYYNQALSRYGANPQDSAMYKRQMQNVGRNQAGAINALNDRRSALSGISGVLRASNDASLNAEVSAENEKSRRFGELGNATGMKAGEDDKAFQINKLAPFERKYNLQSMKAGGGAQVANAGISNIYGAAQSWSNMEMLKKMYGK